MCEFGVYFADSCQWAALVEYHRALWRIDTKQIEATWPEQATLFTLYLKWLKSFAKQLCKAVSLNIGTL